MEQASASGLDVVSDDPREIPAASVGTHGSSTSHVVVAIPTFNEEIAIASLVLRAREHADKVLVIDDGSTDKTVELAKKAGAVVFENGENRGKGFSVQKAFSYAVAAEADCLVLMDGDGQHDPDEIPELVDPITKRTNGDSVDVALGFRVGEMTQMPAWREVPKRIVQQEASKNGRGEIMGEPIGLRAFGEEAIEKLADELQRDDESIEAEEAMVAQEENLHISNVFLKPERARSTNGTSGSPDQESLTMESARTVAAIPAYNEEVAIGSVILRARKHVDEVIVVDDGSSDATVEVAQRAGARVIQHGTNKGYGSALSTIFEAAKKEDWDAVAILDSDGQHDPEDLPRLLEPVIEGDTDLAIGSRFVGEGGKEDVPAYRRLGIGVLTELSNIGASQEHRVKDGQSGFRVFSREAIKAINPRDSDMGISAEILFQARSAGLVFREIPTKVRYDVEGSSQNPVRHGFGVIGSMVRYAEREHPLLALGVPGFLTLLGGLLLAGYALTNYFQTGYLSFGPTVGSAGLILTGLLVGMTGLILHAILNAIEAQA